MLVVLGIVIVRCWLIFSEAEVATAAAAATTVTACYDRAYDEACLNCDGEDKTDISLTALVFHMVKKSHASTVVL